MSLGRRICYRSRSLAIDGLLATPQDPLVFLYPYWCRRPNHRSLYETASARPVALEQTETDSLPSSFSVQQSPDDVNTRRNPTRCNSRPRGIEDKKVAKVVTDKLHNGAFQTPQGIQHALMPLLDQESYNRFKSQKDAEEQPATKLLQKSCNLKPATIRRLESHARHKESSQEKGGILSDGGKKMDTWSYDWRIALLELKQYYRSDDSTTQPNLGEIRTTVFGSYYDVPVQDIPPPNVWSTSTFAHYVQDLGNSEVSRLMQRHVYMGRITHVEAVHDAITRLFEDPSLRPHLSVQAFDSAFRFFNKHSKIPSIRRLFNLMNVLHMDVPVDTYNIILKGAASRKDLRTFTVLLRFMGRRGVSPNANTWVALLAAVREKAVKLYIFGRMREAGALKSVSALHSAVAQLLEFEVASHIAGGLQLQTFLQQLDSQYGANWLSLSACNQLCHLLGSSGLMSQAIDMLTVMRERGCQPDNVTLNIFLAHSLRLRKPTLAFHILQLFQSQHNVSPKQSDYDILFVLCWRSKRLNCCKVLWRLACLQEKASYHMQELVLQSLLRNTPTISQTNTQRWMKEAGKVIVGIDLGITRGQVGVIGRRIMEALCKYQDKGPAREKALEVAKRVLARDLNAARRYVSVDSLTELLERALEADHRWEVDGKRETSTLWKIANSVDVRIRAPVGPNMLGRRQPLSYRKIY